MIPSPWDLVVGRQHTRYLGRRVAHCIGRGGRRTDKAEGDGATPIGAFHITGCLYRPDRLARPAPWAEPIRPGDLWSDDTHDPDYNQPVRAPHDFSHETLSRADKLYDLVLVTNWNIPAQPGRGSAIFLHRWRKPGHPTEGCVAFAPSDLAWIASRAAPGTRIIVQP